MQAHFRARKIVFNTFSDVIQRTVDALPRLSITGRKVKLILLGERELLKR